MSAPSLPVRLDHQGRLVIPVGLRRELGLEEGTELTIRSDGRRLVIQPRSEVLERLRGRFAAVPDDLSLADELLADRRGESSTQIEP